MTRKAALLTEALSHLLLSFVCGLFLFGSFAQSMGNDAVLPGTGGVFFWILTCGLRPFFGLILDEYPRLHAQTAGCVLVGIACLLPVAWGWGALLTAAVGYALFLTGAGGESLAFARGFFSRSALVFAGGLLGMSIGTLAPLWGLPRVIPGLLAFLPGGAVFFFAETRKYPRRIRSFRHSVSRNLPKGAVLGLNLVPLLAISFTAALIVPSDFDGYFRIFPALFSTAGVVAGGYVADRFGPRKAAVIGFSVALPLLTVFTHIPWLCCLGFGALFVPLSVVLGTSTISLSTHPHFAFGLCSVALLVGQLPALFGLHITATVRILAAVFLTVALAVSAFLYSDHCKLFARSFLHRENGGRR
ncbi:MAG: hypothetical protein J6C26_09390 [Clostridia bacterium]|nr:hypothetical protein [Clostridia bacterium]